MDMVHYRCQACGAAMMSSALEAGTLEHCPKCGKANVVPDPQPEPPGNHGSHPAGHASPAGGAAARPAFPTALVFGCLGLGAGFLIAFFLYSGGKPGALPSGEARSPAGLHGSPATQEGHDTQAQLWERLSAKLEKDLDAAKEAASRSQRSLANLLEDGNFAYLPAVLPADANDFHQLGGIGRLAVVFTGSEGLEAAIGVRDLRPTLEAALGDAGFTIDNSRPDAFVLCHVTLVPFQGNADTDAMVYCLVECGVSRMVYVPAARCMVRAMVWMTSAVGMEGSADNTRSVDSPKDAVTKAIADLRDALTKGKS
jgi:hypothetical protein